MTPEDIAVALRLANDEPLADVLRDVRREAWEKGSEASNKWEANPF